MSLSAEILRRVQSHPLFVSAALPRKIYPPKFNRYEAGGAYGSHVDTAGLKAARVAGCDLVLPRSAFAEQLPSRLPAWLTGAPE